MLRRLQRLHDSCVQDHPLPPPQELQHLMSYSQMQRNSSEPRTWGLAYQRHLSQLSAGKWQKPGLPFKKFSAGLCTPRLSISPCKSLHPCILLSMRSGSLHRPPWSHFPGLRISIINEQIYTICPQNYISMYPCFKYPQPAPLSHAPPPTCMGWCGVDWDI